jgi:hypothetical protein
MTRGRKTTTGLDKAIEIAKLRGTVMQFCDDDEEEMACNFLIRNFSHLAFVRVKRSPRSRCSFEDIEAGFEDQISELREILAVAAGVLCELWTYTKHGRWRFYRIQPDGLIEIDRQGNPLQRPVKQKKKSGNPQISIKNPKKTDGDQKVSDKGLTGQGSGPKDAPPSGSKGASGTPAPGSPSETPRPEADPDAKNGTNSQNNGTK